MCSTLARSHTRLGTPLRAADPSSGRRNTPSHHRDSRPTTPRSDTRFSSTEKVGQCRIGTINNGFCYISNCLLNCNGRALRHTTNSKISIARRSVLDSLIRRIHVLRLTTDSYLWEVDNVQRLKKVHERGGNMTIRSTHVLHAYRSRHYARNALHTYVTSFSPVSSAVQSIYRH